MDRPTVSVVIIFLDGERFLSEAIASVLAQSHTQWELLLVDDGSSDGSTELARAWAARMPEKVRYLEHPGHQNRGMSASRNLGIRHARGEFLAFLDADDVWLPGKLERQLALLEAQPDAAMVYGRTLYWYGWSGESDDQALDRLQPHGIAGDRLVRPPQLLAWFLSGKAAVPSVCGILARRSVIERVGGFDESFRGLYEDQVFYAKVCLAYPVFVSDECLDQYRQHPESICATTADSERALSARRRYLEWLRSYVEQDGTSNQELLRALERECWLIRRPGLLPHRLQGRVRWVRKWVLRTEERLLPAGLRRRLWARRASTKPRQPGMTNP